MDLLFAARTPWAWDAERHYKKLAEENPQILQPTRRVKMVHDRETGLLTTGMATPLASVTSMEKRISITTSSVLDVVDSEKRVSVVTGSVPEEHRARVAWAFDPRYTSFRWDDDELTERGEDALVKKNANPPPQKGYEYHLSADRKISSWPITGCYDQCLKVASSEESALGSPRPRRVTLDMSAMPTSVPPPQGPEPRHASRHPLHPR